MLIRYEKFLEEFDKTLDNYFNEHKQYICCKKGCSFCCEIGEYPFSRLEAEYLMKGFLKLSPETQKNIKQNIKYLVENKIYTNYKCPFLINKECSLYKYRGLVCRTHGLAYLDNGIVKLPECVNRGLNYSSVYDSENKELIIENPIKENLRIDSIFQSSPAKNYKLECGEIRPLIKWFLQTE